MCSVGVQNLKVKMSSGSDWVKSGYELERVDLPAVVRRVLLGG